MGDQDTGAARARRLVGEDRLDEALEELLSFSQDDPELSDQVVDIMSQLKRIARQRRRATLSPREEARALSQLSQATLALLSDHETTKSAAAAGEAATVFLSYSHKDTDSALRLLAALEAADIPVRIDRKSMEPGEKIEDFIRRSIRETAWTVCLVSTASLESGWIAQEALRTFWAEESEARRRFIACFADTDFLQPGFRLAATRRIDTRIEKIDTEIQGYLEEKLDTVDLNGERSRLLDLRDDLGDILARLRESLGLDLAGDNFEPSVERLVSTLRAE